MHLPLLHHPPPPPPRLHPPSTTLTPLNRQTDTLLPPLQPRQPQKWPQIQIRRLPRRRNRQARRPIPRQAIRRQAAHDRGAGKKRPHARSGTAAVEEVEGGRCVCAA